MKAALPEPRSSRRRLGAALLWVLLALSLPLSVAHADKRVALFIGNSAYQNTAALSNPANDSGDIAAALRKIGFTVLLEQNLTKRGMEDAITRFSRLAQDADAALFFYAGHGMQYRGSNYLMPVDARLEDEFKLTFELTRLDDVLFGLERARGVKILILDACRDNPLADRLTQTASSRDVVPSHGLTKIEASRGMVIAYSTQANQVAIDGTGRNSPFTAALIREIDEPGVEIGALFRRVAADVNTVTKGLQLPELSVSLIGDFYLNNRDTDLQTWAKIRGSTDRRAFADFIDQYPRSALIADAREHLVAIDRADGVRIEEERQAQAERERLERDRLAKERAERDRLAAEKAEHDRREQERVTKEQAEHDRLAQEQAERPKEPKDALPTAEVAPAPNKAPEQTAMLTPPVELSAPEPTDVLAGGALVEAIKKELTRVGCYSGAIDGDWTGVETKSSLGKFKKYANLPTVPDDPAGNFLDALRGKSGRICPLDCGTRKVERNGSCVAKACQAGFVLTDEGICKKQNGNTVRASSGQSELPQTETVPLSSCSAVYARCVSNVTGRGHPENIFHCTNARSSCLRTGIWDTTIYRHGGFHPGLARK
jgi:hypothetical protein